MIDAWLPLLTFTVATTITPGPNNLLLTASGANFGFRRTLPHLFGVVIGFPVMTLAIGLGLSRFFVAYPAAHEVLKYVGAAYLVFLAYKIATAAPAANDKGQGSPMTFMQAAAFQWVNPKGWAMVVSAVTTYTTVGGNLLGETLFISTVFGLLALPSCAVWAGFGVGIGRLLRAPAALRAFNVAMAALLVASLVPMFI